MKITALKTFILHVPVTRNGVADSIHTLSHWGAPGVIVETETRRGENDTRGGAVGHGEDRTRPLALRQRLPVGTGEDGHRPGIPVVDVPSTDADRPLGSGYPRLRERGDEPPVRVGEVVPIGEIRGH